MLNIKKYLLAALLVLPMLANASDNETVNENPKLMYDFIPYIGATAPKWILNIDQKESESKKVVKTIMYKDPSNGNEYTFNVIDTMLHSVEVRIIDKYEKQRWTLEDKYRKLGIASGIADSLQANGFSMRINKGEPNVRYFKKDSMVVTLDNYKTQYKKDSRDSAILVVFTNSEVDEKIKQLEISVVNRMAIERQSEYKDLIGK